jgi:hypothetical protein
MKAISLFSPSAATVISVLNAASAGLGTVCVKASKRGMSIAVNGKVVASGKNHEELHFAFKERQLQAMTALRTEHAQA